MQRVKLLIACGVVAIVFTEVKAKDSIENEINIPEYSNLPPSLLIEEETRNYSLSPASVSPDPRNVPNTKMEENPLQLATTTSSSTFFSPPLQPSKKSTSPRLSWFGSASPNDSSSSTFWNFAKSQSPNAQTSAVTPHSQSPSAQSSPPPSGTKPKVSSPPPGGAPFVGFMSLSSAQQPPK
ncbi:MAG: hypothetical protein LBP31_03080 [Holosporales bacterium]|nr:hypothetical protein [Holosporales bacterium]